jgi:metallo-beta-lactamase class B
MYGLNLNYYIKKRTVLILKGNRFQNMLFVLLILLACRSTNNHSIVYESPALKIQQVSAHCYMHTSFLSTEKFGQVPCNGMVCISNDQAAVIDTPPEEAVAEELINWLMSDRQSKVNAVVVTHFHVDCLGGLAAFHKRSIPSYGLEKTYALTDQNQYELIQQVFENKFDIEIGDTMLNCSFFGEGHTKDNIVCYYPSDQILFGGCLIKSLGSGKGNLDDANTSAWPATVDTIRTRFPDAQYIIPGHGKPGGRELLDYTIRLFSD